jgi:WD40 repeat protein
VVIAGAGHDGKVYRWDAATGQAIGEPLLGHRISVKAITTASGPDGTTMIVSGCEAGEVRRWDAATGLPIGGPLPGEVGMVGDLAVIDCRGYKLLVCVDFDGGLHRWNLYTGEPVGTTVAIPRGTWLIATDVDGDGDGDVDGDGIPTVFLGVRDDAKASRPVVRWRLDDGTRVDDSLPDTLRAVYRDHGQLRLVLAGDDGSVTVVPA